ncbi:MAG TPA: hypothetical protein VH482_35425 [Thermomicrobiales bacterium]
MRDMTDPGNLDRVDVGETNRPQEEKKTGFPGYVAAQLGVWTVVIIVALVFVVVIAIFAL